MFCSSFKINSYSAWISKFKFSNRISILIFYHFTEGFSKIKWVWNLIFINSIQQWYKIHIVRMCQPNVNLKTKIFIGFT